MRFMNKRIELRINDELTRQIKRVVQLNPEVYFSISHFVRVAVMRELRRKFKNKNY